ncbi:MAG: DUF1704 domain-containing protein [Candidatus Gracilibacteria bacterium]|jgi:alpha-L-glutamate ligase-like protein/uncharacterized protein (TIGR02421 family)|nr:DUF1704 domain-containing protein [Candidatus Gracilibacteria bacterium]
MNLLKSLFSNKGVLGINGRNVLYLKPFNPKKAIKMADNKIKSKKFLSTRGVPVPKLYQIIKDRKDLENFNFKSLPSSFVLKPNKGYGGEGIIPIIGKSGSKYLSASGKEHSKQQIEEHILDILDGRYSINNAKDEAFFEQLIISDDRIGKYSYKGLPDIRVVVHNLVPIMAMLRLPTKESDGKANLHLGAVGVGIDIAKGQTTHICYKNKIIEEIPQIGNIRGIKIPFWDEILLIASRIQLITNLGYLAVDICIDKHMGPVLLEINARAGLSVQIANMAPLRQRLEQVRKIKITNPTKGVRVAKDLFGNVIEKEIKQISGKTLIKPVETIEIIKKNETLKFAAQIDTSKKKSKIRRKLAIAKGLLNEKNSYDEKNQTIKLKFSLKGKRIITVFDLIDGENKEYEIILGRRDLSDFLIDPSLVTKKDHFIPKPIIKEDIKENEYEKIDNLLYSADTKAKIINYVKPVRITLEKRKFLEDETYTPKLRYKELRFRPEEEMELLSNLKFDDSVLGQLFRDKRDEIVLKMDLIKNIGKENFTDLSKKLYGQPSEKEVNDAKKLLIQHKNDLKSEEIDLLNFEEAKLILEKTLRNYSLENWSILGKRNMISSCSTKKNKIILLKKTAYFSRNKLEKLITHEIETHLLTNENGATQAYNIFKYGLKDYLKIQEGLAMYNIEKKFRIPFSSNKKIASLIIAMSMPEKTISEIIKILIKEYGITQKDAFGTALKVKRGVGDENAKGIFTKDYLYFSGYKAIKEFENKGGDLKDLYIGKVNIEYLEKIKTLPFILSPKYLPNWYTNK